MKIKIPMTLTLTIDIPVHNWDEIAKASNQLTDTDDVISFYEAFGIELSGTLS
jgi:hypothetical protein